MPQIIASTYELREKIGSGGAGVVYLGEHVRLGKPVVLKADRRTLSTKPEVLRREVDALKNLSHTYIPQVYDFVVEGDTVYTVMDYIEGESLDRPLARGERFSQVQVIEWACQLLEALCYLHSRPPHGILHSDIKPANIMVTPQGDIRLIDFNIALALGESGSVRVGYSRGYASPEHYGVDYSSRPADEDATELLVDRSTQVSQGPRSRTTAGGRTVLLDVRSDVYSLGATLYHLLGGQRPAQDAQEVTPLTGPGISPAVSAILQKAMAPDPEQRYQTAEEMLEAFRHLHDNDPRTIRHRRQNSILTAVFLALFLAGGLCTFAGLKQTQEAEAEARLLAEAAEAAERSAKNALAAVTDSEAAWAAGDVLRAVDRALEALSLESPYAPQAQRALTEALGVYELSGGFRAYRRHELPSEPMKLALSPGGTRVGAMVLGRALVFDTESGELLADFPAERSALSDLVFSGEDVVLYAGEGALRAYDLGAGRELWAGEPATTLALSADGSVVAGVYKDASCAAVYEAFTGAALAVVDFGGQTLSVPPKDVFADPEDDLFALNGDGSLLAVSFAGGGMKVFGVRESGAGLTAYETSDFTHFQGGFYGKYLAYSAQSAVTGENVFGVIDTAAKEMTGGFTGDSMPYRAFAGEAGIFLSNNDVLVRLDPETGEQTELAYTAGEEITGYALSGEYTIVRTAENTAAIFDRKANRLNAWECREACGFADIAGSYAVFGGMDAPTLRLVRLEDHPEALLASYDPEDRHSEARVSADGKTVMLFRYDGFSIYTPEGTLVAREAIPDALEVYDQQFRREGAESRLEVLYNDGLLRSYSAADGSLLAETRGERPDESLQEEFLTDRLRIERPVHGTPRAYDRAGGELLCELEPEDYLIYVTQAGGYVVTEYIDSQGGRYGLLLDEECRTLARLPGLCDVLEDGTLVFDDQLGNLRQSRMYSLQELTALGEQYRGGAA